MPDETNEHAAGDLQEILILNQELERVRADLKEARERVAALEAAMNPQDVADVDAALRNKEKSNA